MAIKDKFLLVISTDGLLDGLYRQTVLASNSTVSGPALHMNQ